MNMRLILTGLGLVFIGAIILAFSEVLSSPQVSGTTSSNVGGFILIGPIPIVFGSGNQALFPQLMTFGIILTIIAILFYVLPFILLRKNQRN
ncbi:conserved membrane protein [Sulfolobus acidocaldarius DSM 639]|uniref:Conserved membrane protein n=4 Tax=Sulfolobus acidocaldarius TaxID=2285 RepID=Q4JAE5_SULAC|nr:conserved membrane protein [Sulfolobus acidocaldarius DSM 639]